MVDEHIVKDSGIVLIIGAGIHSASTTKNSHGDLVLHQLASWDGVQDGCHDGNLLGQTLAWELNGLDDGDDVVQAAKRLKSRQILLAEKLCNLAQQAKSFGWKPPSALQLLLKSAHVTDVISLNVDLVLEHWLVDALNLESMPCVHEGVDGKRRRVFQTNVGMVTFWYPHGDIETPSTLQFSLSSYAKSMAWMEGARGVYKGREKQGAEEAYDTWLDPLLSKKALWVLGASLDQSEWDIWYALLCRWHNFARFETEDWYPETLVLTRRGETKHAHLPQGYIKKMEHESYPDAWRDLEERVKYLTDNSC